MKTETAEKTFSIALKEAENYAIGGMINDQENLVMGCESLSTDDFYLRE